MPFLGQRSQALREQLDLADVHGELVALRAPDRTLDAHEVAHVEALHEIEQLGRELGLARADLEPLPVLEQRREHELAERAQRDHAPRDRGALWVGRERGGIALAEALAHGRERFARADARRVRVHAGRAQRGQLRAPDVALAHAARPPRPGRPRARAASRG